MPRDRQELLMLVEGAEDGSEEPLSEDNLMTAGVDDGSALGFLAVGNRWLNTLIDDVG